jgi:hypothetical protein
MIWTVLRKEDPETYDNHDKVYAVTEKLLGNKTLLKRWIRQRKINSDDLRRHRNVGIKTVREIEDYLRMQLFPKTHKEHLYSVSDVGRVLSEVNNKLARIERWIEEGLIDAKRQR